MAVKIRLRREGKRKQPYYRVVVADVRSPRDGRFIDDLGYYQPLREPSAVSIDPERALHWLRNGAQPTDAVRKLLRIEGIWEQFRPGDPGRDRGGPVATPAATPATPRTPGSDDVPEEAVTDADTGATRPPAEDAAVDAEGPADTADAADGQETAS